MDGWATQEFALLSDAAVEEIAKMLNAIEAGADWPHQCKSGRAAFLSKDKANSTDALNHRVLTILPVLYRRYATRRLRDIKPWVNQWRKDNMFAGVDGEGAMDAWWETALDLELLDLVGTHFTAGAIDIAKCFDKIRRPLLKLLCEHERLPYRILEPYIRYQQQLALL